MAIAQSLLPEFDMEMANTRKTLERVKDDKWDFKPHLKSGSMGWLAGHLSNLPLWATTALSQDTLDVASGFTLPELKNREEVLANFEKNVNEARQKIAAATDDQLQSIWTLQRGGHKLMAMPKAVVLRSFVMNHMIHHRAQLAVYLRLNDIPVPALYGPSADEGSF